MITLWKLIYDTRQTNVKAQTEMKVVKPTLSFKVRTETHRDPLKILLAETTIEQGQLWKKRKWSSPLFFKLFYFVP